MVIKADHSIARQGANAHEGRDRETRQPFNVQYPWYFMDLWHRGIILIILILLTGSAGCIDAFFEKPVVQQPTPTSTPLPIVTSTPDSLISTITPSEMALQLTDLPGDYFIRDRSATSYDEQSALSRDLGWKQGYFVSFYRMNLDRVDITGITQTINVYPLENMNKVYSVEKDALFSIDNATELFEIPFPVLGDRSIAARKSSVENRQTVVTYTVIFTKKNAFEKISMTGTTTDSETLKDVAAKAAAAIR